MDELDVREKTIGICPVGCGYWLMNILTVICWKRPGRAPAVATGLKRVLKDRVIFTYQGDGDLASIGMAEIVHAASRGEKISVFFINNTVYGMTGGQMAPTTLLGQVTTTSPYGRDKDREGYPIRIAEMLAPFEGAVYVARVAINTPANVARAKRAIKKAFETQLNGTGFSLVEILSTCPTNWGLSPVEAMQWLADNMIPYYPLGVYKGKEGR